MFLSKMIRALALFLFLAPMATMPSGSSKLSTPSITQGTDKSFSNALPIGLGIAAAGILFYLVSGSSSKPKRKERDRKRFIKDVLYVSSSDRQMGTLIATLAQPSL